jgi:hypothetical protein
MSSAADLRTTRGTREGNPYVGPRPFRADELFYGRELETRALVNKLLPCGVTLLHAPSGAGKTSIVQAAVVPAFLKHGFLVCGGLQPRFSALRVNLPPPPDLPVRNRYVFSMVNALVGHLVNRGDAALMSIEDGLALFAQQHPDKDKQLVVIDQLEEILTLRPDDLDGQHEFFHQLGAALRHPNRWGLLTMREDYMGGLDRFKRHFPNELRTTFRLDFLDEQAAIRAVQLPPRAHGVHFSDDAATQLVTDLRRVRTGAEGADPVLYPYVEPVLLQVVCDNLWRKLGRPSVPGSGTITVADLELVKPYAKILSKYYRGVIHRAADRNPDTERALRDWIDRCLISKQTLRRPTRELPPVPDPSATLAVLQGRYLIRDDPRPGGTWWELSHDMLVQPIVEDNRTWRLSNLQPWQVLAEEWADSGRDSGFLLSAASYREARWQSRRSELSPLEISFLDASNRMIAEESTRARLESRISAFRVAIATSVACNIILVYLQLRGS